MKKKEFVSHLQNEISNGEAILDRFERLQEYQNDLRDGMAVLGHRPIHNYNPNEKTKLTNDFTLWERRVLDILKCYLGERNSVVEEEFTLSNSRYWTNFKSSGINCMNSNLTTLRSYLERVDYLSPKEDDAISDKGEVLSLSSKPFKVFISHSGEDIAFVEELVKLLEFLGISTPEKLLCSSIKGYQIPTSEDFAKYILKQFYDYNLFVIIVHSQNYYSSPYSLNEMGAAWVLKKEFFSFLVKGFDYNEMSGVIDGHTISVKVDAADAKARLNELKDKLIPLFNLQGFNETRWETRRDEFLEKVNSLSISVANKNADIFTTCYIPIFDKILSFLDMPNYPYWTYFWAMDGASKISVRMYQNLEEFGNFLNRINRHKGYERYDNLLENLRTLISDYLNLCEIHLKPFGDEFYTIERFYKNIPNNPDYDEQLNEFNEYSYLICDMTLELTRLLNLILERIREIIPNYHIEEGVFIVNSIDREKTEYQMHEKTDNPYPGLRRFVMERSKRNYSYSKSDHLNFIFK